MENRIWVNNIKALEKKVFNCEELLRLKMEEADDERICVKLGKSYTGEQISTVTINDREYYLTGKYNPSGMAEQQVSKIDVIDYGAVIYMIGMAEGRTLRILEKKLKEKAVVIVYEPSFEIFLHTMRHYDITDLLESEKICFFIEGINQENISAVLSSVIDLDNVQKISTLILKNYSQMFSSEVKKAISILNKRVQDVSIKWNTWALFSKETLENNIENCKYLFRHYSVNQLFGMLSEEVPAIIVAAGPSLDKNIEMLKGAKGKACIIACDTALKPLLKREIIPDFFVVVDPKKPLELFDEPRIQNIPMICGLNIPVKVMEQHTGKKFFWLDEWFVQEILEYVFRDNLSQNPMDGVPTGGSVATSAFSIGRLMGAKTIILVGQDLALTEKRQHASNTFSGEQLIEVNDSNYPLVKDINGEMVYTLKNLKYYLEWFEKQIASYEELHVVDATEGGALIHGSEILSLREAIESYCKKEFDVQNCINHMREHFSDKERQKVIEFFKDIPKRLDKIQKEISQGQLQYKKLEKCVKKKTYSLDELKKILRKLKKINQVLDTDSIALLLAEGIKNEEYYLRANVYKFQNDERADLLESAQMAKCFLDNLEKQLQKERSRLMRLSEFQGEYKC